MIEPLMTVLLHTPLGELRALSDELDFSIPEWLQDAITDLDPELTLSTVPREALLSLGLKAWKSSRKHKAEFALSSDDEEQKNYLLVCRECGHLQEVKL